MKISSTKLDDVYILESETKSDKRGYFVRTFDKKILENNNINFHIVQTSQSLTKRKDTLRGMHFQSYPKEEKKIIRCVQGKIFDVVVNINKKSPQFGKYFSIELSERNIKLLYIPEGYAHGFITLTDNCIVEYFMDQYYSSENSSGVAWNDPFFSIKWPIKNPILSDKDKTWPFIKSDE